MAKLTIVIENIPDDRYDLIWKNLINFARHKGREVKRVDEITIDSRLGDVVGFVEESCNNICGNAIAYHCTVSGNPLIKAIIEKL